MIIKLDTYCARSGIRNSSIILHPAMVRTFLMSIWTIKNCSDVSHAIHTNSRTFEDWAEKKHQSSITLSFILWHLLSANMIGTADKMWACSYSQKIWIKCGNSYIISNDNKLSSMQMGCLLSFHGVGGSKLTLDGWIGIA